MSSSIIGDNELLSTSRGTGVTEIIGRGESSEVTVVRGSQPIFPVKERLGRRLGTGMVVDAEAAGSVDVGNMSPPDPIERLARLRAQGRQRQLVPSLSLWWSEVSGTPMKLEKGSSGVHQAAILLGLYPSFDFAWENEIETVTEDGEYVVSVEEGLEVLAADTAELGCNPYLVRPELTAVGLIDCDGHHSCEVLRLLLLHQKTEGDLFALLSRRLNSGLVINWDREQQVGGIGNLRLQVRKVEMPRS